MIPERTRQILEPFLGSNLPWNDINLTIGNLPHALAPSALIPRNVMAVSARGIARALKAVGMTIHRNIWIDKSHADFETAAGLSLLAHELVHVEQFEQIPNFDKLYHQAAWAIPRDQPYLNPYEETAYRTEVEVYCALLAEGYPKGKWEPLGVALWGGC